MNVQKTRGGKTVKCHEMSRYKTDTDTYCVCQMQSKFVACCWGGGVASGNNEFGSIEMSPLRQDLLRTTWINDLSMNINIFTNDIWIVSTFWDQLKNTRPTWCHLIFYFTSYVLNMFRTLIYPSSGAGDYSVELPHWSYCSWFDVCWSFGVVGLEWYPCCRLKLCNTDTTPTQPHRNANTHRTKNNRSMW